MAMKVSPLAAINDASPPLLPPSSYIHHFHKFKNNTTLPFLGDLNYPFLLASPNSNLSSSSLCIGELATGSDKHKSGRFSTRASEQQPEERSIISPIALLDMHTSAGKRLIQILEKNPHRFPQSLNHEIDLLKADMLLAPESFQYDTYSSGFDVRREGGRYSVSAGWGNKLEEVMYTLVINTFLENKIFKVQTISDGVTPHTEDHLHKLRLIHRPELLLMLSRYLNVVEAKHLFVAPSESGLFEPSLEQLAKAYSASIIIGYYFGRLSIIIEAMLSTTPEHDGKSTLTWAQSLVSGPSSLLPFPEDISYQLRETIRCDKSLQKVLATVQSDHALALVGKQSRAVLDRYDYSIVQGPRFDLPADEGILVSRDTFTGLMLEAVAFGKFLLQSENYIRGCLC